MSSTYHLFEWLELPVADLPTGLGVFHGNQRFLKTLAVAHIAHTAPDELSVSRLEGATVTWTDVHDELSTRSLFGGDAPKLVIVDEADKFVSDYRDRLEPWAAARPVSRLVLIVDSWQKSTRLCKQVAKTGFQVDCGPPLKSGRSKQLDAGKAVSWLQRRAKREYGFQLPAAGGQMLLELTDGDFGRMDQELQKLLLFAEEGAELPLETIQQVVGGWRTRTMWDALDAALMGDSGRALDRLDLIFRGGEHPLALFGSLSWSLRRYANATEEVLRQMRAGRKPNLPSALKSAGLAGWGGANAEQQLKQIGSARAQQLSQWLLEADLQLKRSHSQPQRGRLVLETLLVRLSDQLHPQRATSGQA